MVLFLQRDKAKLRFPWFHGQLVKQHLLKLHIAPGLLEIEMGSDQANCLFGQRNELKIGPFQTLNATFYSKKDVLRKKQQEMASASRHYIPGCAWHIIHRCHKQEFLLKFSKDRRCWLGWLFEAKKRFEYLY